jgi:hypothetical protein
MRVLDLDDFGAHLRGEDGGEWLGDDGTRGEDAHALEGAELFWDKGLFGHMAPPLIGGTLRAAGKRDQMKILAH